MQTHTYTAVTTRRASFQLDSLGRAGRSVLAALVGLVAASVSMFGSWVPSYWSDEVATLRATRLDWPELVSFVGHKDAVHAAYYSLMKLWLGLFGESELAARSLSALAIGVAAAGLVLLVSALATPSLAAQAGLIFSVLPRTTYSGIEARSFALSVAFAVWLTLVLLVASRRKEWGWWLLYGVVATCAIYVFLYSVLILLAHLVYLAITRQRGIRMAWACAALAALAASLPILLIASSQKNQISWLAEQPVVNIWTILVEPIFDSSWLVAALAWLALLLLAARSRTIWHGPNRLLFVLAASWFLVPLLALLAADAVAGPLYTARYLTFTTPAVAILLALVFRFSARRFVTLSLVAALLLAALPTYLEQRGPLAKNGGSDLAEIADFIDAHAQAGDAFYLQDTGSVTLRPRLALYAYPASFADARDVAFVESFASTGTFSDRTVPLEDLEPRVAGVRRIWVATAGRSGSAADEAALHAFSDFGFHAQETHATNRSLITLYTR